MSLVQVIRQTMVVLAIWAGFACIEVSAQTVLTPENTILPLVGQDLVLLQHRATPPGDLSSVVLQTGANVTWDLTGGAFSEPVELPLSYQIPPFGDLPGKDAAPFRTANLAQIVIDPSVSTSIDVVNYSILGGLQLVNLGFATLTDDVTGDNQPDLFFASNDPPELKMQYPVTEGSTWTSESTQTITIEGQGSVPGLTLKNDYSVTGWGTLVTPVGIVEVLQIDIASTPVVAGFEGPVSRSMQFVGPLEEVSSGKSAYRGISADVFFDEEGTVTEVSYTLLLTGEANPTSAEGSNSIPNVIEIRPNYPNPFNPSTVIPFSIDRPGHVLGSVYDALGRHVDTIVDEVIAAGNHTVSWEARGLPSGVYQVRFSRDGIVQTRPIILQR